MKLLCDGWCADYDIKLKGMPEDELKDVFKDIYKYLVLNFHDQDLNEAGGTGSNATVQRNEH